MEYKNKKIKIPGGKLLEISLRYDSDKFIEKIVISGDFFMHPEVAVEELELFLIQKEINEDLIDDINRFLDETDTEIIGFSTEDLVKSIVDLSK